MYRNAHTFLGNKQSCVIYDYNFINNYVKYTHIKYINNICGVGLELHHCPVCRKRRLKGGFTM